MTKRVDVENGSTREQTQVRTRRRHWRQRFIFLLYKKEVWSAHGSFDYIPRMRKIFFLILFVLAAPAFASSSQIFCEMKRDEWKKMTFEFRFLTPKRAVAVFHYSKDELEGKRSIRVTAVHKSSEARYIGLNFLGEEKLVFILLTPIFTPENLEIPMEIEVVSSIYGPIYLKCRALK